MHSSHISLDQSCALTHNSWLTREKRAQALHLLCEGNSIRAVTRLTGISKTTVTKLVLDAGQACSWYQDRVFRNLECKRIQVDEVWGFVGAKAKYADSALKAAGRASDVWLWVATDADTKLVPAHAMALHYNSVRIHKTLRTTPAMAAGVTKRLWEIGDIVDVLDAWECGDSR